MSRCLQRCARGSEPLYLSPDGLPEAPSKHKTHLKPETPLHFTLCLFPPRFPPLSCRLVFFVPNQLSLSTAGSCSLFLTFRDEAALARRALMGAQRLNCCPNPAHLAGMTNRILFWKRRGGKKKRKSIFTSSQAQFKAVNPDSGDSRYIQVSQIPYDRGITPLQSPRGRKHLQICKFLQ